LTGSVLTTTNHDRDNFGLSYVYPVVSRRAGGVSIGINLNPNNACNWACVYCQVPNLTRGGAPDINLLQLESELQHMLQQVLHGDFMAQHVPPEARRLNDVAFSGNGEPTSAACFADAIAVVERQLQQFGLLGQIKVVLISNGSLMARPQVQQALRRLAAINGEVWFKLDRGSSADVLQVKQVNLSIDAVLRHLAIAAELCPTWVQTCMFAMDGQLPDDAAVDAYLQCLQQSLAEGVKLQGVLLYGLARPSLQPAAGRLSAAPEAWMKSLAEKIKALGLFVKLSA
jgi:wyosine [tRNA(Phe)-imidazoG37] synthetase (radical SAM superfamily)